jgi:hypothetical protein
MLRIFSIELDKLQLQIVSSREKKGIRLLDQSPRLWRHCAFDSANRL